MDKRLVLDIIDGRVQRTDDYKDNYGDNYFDEYDTKTLEKLLGEGFSVTLEDRFGGEGKGEDYYIVYKISKGNETIFIKSTGYYSSWEGTDFSVGETSIVEPYQKTVRDWKQVS